MATGSRAGSQFGHYELRRLLGVGGMGEVYEAFDTTKGRIVALKLLDVELARDPTYVERFRRESLAAARLQEPHVIPVHDWGDVDGVLYIDMRLVQGHDLKARLRERGPMAPADAVSVIEQIASALDAAHELGLVHRDVKPANILLTHSCFAYLVDFGIAHSESDAQLTVTGSAVGSFAYMAPERFDNAPVTSAVDVYSLACVLYECLTGRVPFPANSFPVAIRSHQMVPPPRPSTESPVLRDFDTVIGRGMAKNPHHRFGTAGELAAAARVASARAASSGVPVTPSGRPPAPSTVITPVQEPPTRRTHPSAPLPLPPTRRPPEASVSLRPTRPGPTHPSGPVPLTVPPPKSGSMSPLLAGAAGALLVLLAAGIVTWVLLADRDNGGGTGAGSSAAPSAGAATTSVDLVTTSLEQPSTTTASRPTTTTGAAAPPPFAGALTGTDEQGFLTGPRCNADNLAMTIARTTSSRIVVCRTGVGRYYYKGIRISDGLGIELDDPVPNGGGAYTATNPTDGTQYRIFPSGLTIVQGGSVVANETAVEFASR